MIKVYISGPMEAYNNHNRGSFAAMQDYLKREGFEPVNPFDLKVDPNFKVCDKDTRRDFMRKDIRALTYCDAVMMLDGWSRSHGALLERQVAIEIGLDIMYEDEL